MASWTEAFSTNTAVRGVFTVRTDYRSAVQDFVKAFDLPTETVNQYREPLVRTWAFLDGGVHYINSEGVDLYALRAPWRVIGWRSMRALCQLWELMPPRRLAGEPEVIDPDDLLTQVRSTVDGDAGLQEQAKRLASINDPESLRAVAGDLLGGP